MPKTKGGMGNMAGVAGALRARRKLKKKIARGARASELVRLKAAVAGGTWPDLYGAARAADLFGQEVDAYGLATRPATVPAGSVVVVEAAAAEDVASWKPGVALKRPRPKARCYGGPPALPPSLLASALDGAAAASQAGAGRAVRRHAHTPSVPERLGARVASTLESPRGFQRPLEVELRYVCRRGWCCY